MEMGIYYELCVLPVCVLQSPHPLMRKAAVVPTPASTVNSREETFWPNTPRYLSALTSQPKSGRINNGFLSLHK